MVKELQINNTDAIDQLATNHKWGLTVNIGFSSIATFLVISMLLRKKLISKRKEIIITPPVINTNPSVNLSMPELSENRPDTSTGIKRISHIPYF